MTFEGGGEVEGSWMGMPGPVEAQVYMLRTREDLPW